MADITLTRAQAQQLSDFCAKHKLAQFFITKNHGAYVGASTGLDGEQCLFYFKGCNPKTDAEWWDNQQSKFGGDDFGEHLNIEDINNMLAHPTVASIRLRVTKTRIALDGLSAPKKAAPNKSALPAFLRD